MIEVYKIMTDKYDTEATPNLKRYNPDIHTRGHDQKLAKERPTTKLRQHYFVNRIK